MFPALPFVICIKHKMIILNYVDMPIHIYTIHTYIHTLQKDIYSNIRRFHSKEKEKENIKEGFLSYCKFQYTQCLGKKIADKKYTEIFGLAYYRNLFFMDSTIPHYIHIYIYIIQVQKGHQSIINPSPKMTQTEIFNQK